MSLWETRDPARPWRRIPGVHFKAAEERSSGVDDRLAAIFRDMRAGLNMSTVQLARTLKTTPDVINQFETGRVRAFPAWAETVRIVSDLGVLLRVDTRPILARIHDQVGPAGLGMAPGTSKATGPAARNEAPRKPRGPSLAQIAQSNHPLLRAMARRNSADAAPVSGEIVRKMRRGMRRAAKTTFALSAPVILAGGVVWLAQTQPGLLSRGANALPGPIATVARSTVDYLVLQMAPRRDGLRWIEVSDPRARKSDKLRQASR